MSEYNPRIVITLLENGPIMVNGAVSIVGEGFGQSVGELQAIALCRCGQSDDKPFCDGSHKEAEQGLPAGEIE